MRPEHIAWSRNQFEMLAERGVWGVPRSGLVFQRQGDTLVLIARMPHDPLMPITPAELAEQQQAEYDGIAEHMQAAGVTMRDDTDPM